MLSTVLQSIREVRDYIRLTPLAKAEYNSDRLGLPTHDPGIDRVIEEGMAWLGRAQDNSISQDGGVSRHFSLRTGWGASYPETTGYIVPTQLAYAKLRRDEIARQRSIRMLDWLVSIQFPDGGFQGGVIGAEPRVPVTFNTGQILLGLAEAVREFGALYQDSMRRAADWLVKTQDSDGCWRKHPTPFAAPGEKAYETHVAWGLFEAARVEPESPYAATALANVRWALRLQHENGWFDNCCLTDSTQPLTHTLGYVLRGIVEAYRFTNDESILDACRRMANGLLTAIRDDGFLPGRLDAAWRGKVRWSCLTGSVQIAHCWLMMYQYTNDNRYRDAAYAANEYVRRTVNLDGALEVRGAVKGSFPVQGGYNAYEYPNWACKFLVDSNLLERAIKKNEL